MRGSRCFTGEHRVWGAQGLGSTGSDLGSTGSGEHRVWEHRVWGAQGLGSTGSGEHRVWGG